MHRDAVLVGDLGQLTDRVDGPDLAIGQHHADDDGMGSDRLAERRGVHAAGGIDLQVSHLKAQVFERFAGSEDRWVLYDARDDVLPLVSPRQRDALDGQVVALGAATGEDDAPRSAAQRLSDLPACALNGVFRLAAAAVDARRVAVPVLEEWEHRVQHLGVQRGRGVVVQVHLSPRGLWFLRDRDHGLALILGRAASAVAGLSLHDVAEQSLVHRESRDRIVAVQISQIVDVTILPLLWAERAAASHIGVDGAFDDVVGDLRSVLDLSAWGRNPHPIPVLDAPRHCVTGAHGDARFRRLSVEAGHTVVLAAEVSEDTGARVEDQRVFLRQGWLGQWALTRLGVDGKPVVAMLFQDC